MITEDSRITVGRLRLSRGGLWGLFCCGLLLAMLCLVHERYSSSANFEPIHVQLTGKQWQDCRVFFQSIYGSWGQLAVDSRYSGRWMQSPSVNGVVRVLVECPGEQRVPGQAVEVRTGINWSAARTVPVRREVLPEKLPTEAGGLWTCLEFSPPANSWFPPARGTINWQGDLWLVLVPIMQMLTLGGTGLFCRGLIKGIRSGRH